MNNYFISFLPIECFFWQVRNLRLIFWRHFFEYPQNLSDDYIAYQYYQDLMESTEDLGDFLGQRVFVLSHKTTKPILVYKGRRIVRFDCRSELGSVYAVDASAHINGLSKLEIKCLKVYLEEISTSVFGRAHFRCEWK